MPNLEHRCQPVADPIAGYAFFDGLFIRTDSFTDPSWDRVMPILEEEQVFMCHEMARADGPLASLAKRSGEAINVLDVGTGSGIFAVFLDRFFAERINSTTNRAGVRPPKIVALDISQRAIEFVKENAARNICQFITTLCAPYADDLFEDSSQDLIVINPPYHPTHPFWSNEYRVAVHGEAGEDGLRVFREWIRPIVKHLREGGWLIGSVMSPCTAQDQDGIVAFKELQEAFSNRAIIHYCYHLTQPFVDNVEFLRGVYADHLNNDKIRPSLENWIEEKTKGTRWRTVVYFEVQRRAANGGPYELMKPVFDSSGVTWEQRMRAHRLMSNNAQEHQSQLPLQGLLGAYAPPYPTELNFDSHQRYWESKNGGSTANVTNAQQEMLKTTALADVGRYIRDSRLLDVLDCIVVDCAPLFAEAGAGLLDVDNQECGCWSTTLRENQVEAIVTAYQETMVQYQTQEFSPFFDPYLVQPGSFGWSAGCTSSLPPPISAAQEPREVLELLEVYRAKVSPAADGLDANAVMAPVVLSNQRIIIAYSTSRLSRLRVESNRREGNRIMWLDHWLAIQKRFEGHKKHDESEEAFIKRNLVATHRLVHEALADRLKAILKSQDVHSVYLCLPIQLSRRTACRKTLAELCDDPVLPATYGGAFWILAVAKKAPAQLSKLLSSLADFVLRTLTSAYIVSVWAKAPAEAAARRRSREDRIMLAHELKYIAEAIDATSPAVVLDEIRKYVFTQCLDARTIQKRAEYLPAGFGEGENLGAFVRNAFSIATRIDDISTACRESSVQSWKDTDLIPDRERNRDRLKISDEIAELSVCDDCRPRAWCSAAFVCAFLNVLKNDADDCEVTFSITGNPPTAFEISNIDGPPSQQNNDKVGSTEESLRIYATHYGGNPTAVRVFYEDNAWRTRFPIPPSLLIDLSPTKKP